MNTVGFFGYQSQCLKLSIYAVITSVKYWRRRYATEAMERVRGYGAWVPGIKEYVTSCTGGFPPLFGNGIMVFPQMLTAEIIVGQQLFSHSHCEQDFITR